MSYLVRAQNSSGKVWTVTFTDPTGHRSGNTTGIDNAGGTAAAMKIYPDPASDYIVINATGGKDASVVTIVDMIGRVMYQQQLPVTDQIQHLVDLSAFASGSYIVYLSTGDRMQQGKFVVKK